MPEIWLSYGPTDVVLDIMAENLSEHVDQPGPALAPDEVSSRLGPLATRGGSDLVLMHDSPAIRQAVSSLHLLCEQKSLPPPRILADARTLATVRPGLPQGCQTSEYDAERPDAKLTFVSEVEFDGLFGYETAATRILRMFGGESMLAAYSKRRGNEPAPGHAGGPMEEAKKFSSGFEIRAVDIVASHAGISDLRCGHPSETAEASSALESAAVRDAGRHKCMILGTGKHSSNDTLSRSLRSLWNCSGAMEKDGLAILVGECGRGLGSDALRQAVEGRLSKSQLGSPPRYVDGMEDLLFLSWALERFQIGLVSALPEFYSKKLGLVPLDGAKSAMDYVLRVRGQRQKAAVISDGARTLLR